MATQSVVRSAVPKDGYAPTMRVLVDGKVLTTQRATKVGDETIPIGDVVDLSVTLDLKDPGQFSLTLSNWSDRSLELLYGESFKLGQPISIDLGYADELTRVFTGKISTLAPTFPDGGAPTITIRGQDAKRGMANIKPRDGEKTRFENATDIEVAREVARRLKLRARIPDKPGLPRELIVIKNQTYAQFLAERASRIEFEFYVDVDDDGLDALYFVPRADGRDSTPVEAFVLVWGLGEGRAPSSNGASDSAGDGVDQTPSLISFSTSMTDNDQVKELTVQGWDPKTKSAIAYTATDKDLARAPAKRQQENVAAEGSNDVIVHKTVASKEEARKLAISLLKERRNQFAKGSGKVVGLPGLRPGKLVELRGLGPRFSGDYYVTKVEHSLGGSGFVTSFDVDRSRLKAK